MKRMTLVCLLASAVGAMVSSGAIEDEVDPRVRTYVWPQRLVWQTPPGGYGRRFEIIKPEALIEDSYAQRHVSLIWKCPGCELVNNGNPAGVLLDFGREIHGGIQLCCGAGTLHGTRVRIRLGESVGEAMSSIGEKGATNDHAVRDQEITVPFMGSIEVGNTGFRFARIDVITPGRLALNGVRAVSLMRPMPQVGAFKSSDERLNEIWRTAVHTIHLCCQDCLWDGIKRDRLAWMGDTHPEIRTVLSVFGADEVLTQTFEYMEQITKRGSWMNNMPSYTLWYLRNIWEWWRFTGDNDFLLARKSYLTQTLDQVIAGVTPDGACTLKGFLDWPTEHNQVAVTNGMRALCAVSLDCGSQLANAFGDEALAKRCAEASSRLRNTNFDPAGSKAAAAILALSGVADFKKTYDDILSRNGHEGVSTFYGYYILEAMSAAGANQHAMDTIREYWGGMLDMGATSFWEDFKLAWTNNATRIDELPRPGKVDVHGDYGEFCYPGYRHSLCHGWSSGPAAWLIHHVLGINIVGNGCRKVSVKPFLGDLDWAEGAMATPFGPVKVRAEKTASGEIKTTISAPPQVKVER